MSAVRLCERSKSSSFPHRLLVEPHLSECATHITGLYGLMRDTAHAELGARLAKEWLNAFPGLPAEVEEEFTGRLIAAREADALRDFAAKRLSLPDLGERRRRNWQALALWTDFATVAPTLVGIGTRDPALLWALRDRVGGGRHRDDPSGTMSIALMGWIVREFRAAFQRRERPDGVTHGETNAWDASDYIARMIGQIGDDTGEEAVEILTALRDAPTDGYTDYLRRVATEQAAIGVGNEPVDCIMMLADQRHEPAIVNVALLLGQRATRAHGFEDVVEAGQRTQKSDVKKFQK
jgi:hypothetical protein